MFLGGIDERAGLIRLRAKATFSACCLKEQRDSLKAALALFDLCLTEPEFRQAAAILNEMGKLTSDSHNEPMLMAGSLGVSSLVCLLNNGDGGNSETSQSLLGPFWRLNSPRVANGGTIVRSDTPGDPLIVTARVVDRSGAPIAGAEVDAPRRSASMKTRIPSRPT